MFYPVYSSREFQCYPRFDFTRFFHRGFFPSLSASTIYVYAFKPNNGIWESKLIHLVTRDSSPYYSISPSSLGANSIIALSFTPLYECIHFNLDKIKEKFLTLKNPFFRAQYCITTIDRKLSSFYAGEFPLFRTPSSLVSFIPYLPIDNPQYICLITPSSTICKKDPLYVLSNGNVEDKIMIETNSMQIIPLKSAYKNICIVSPYICGVPLLLVKNTESLSIEHTHPLCEYFHGPHSFAHMGKLKSKVMKFLPQE